MKIKPLHDRVLVLRIEEEEKTAGGIVIPDTAKEKPQEGKVIAVGPGKLNEKGERVALQVKKNDRVLFGKYSVEAMQGISTDRTSAAANLIQELGGNVVSMYALLGAYDLMLIVQLPGIQEAVKASVALGKKTGIAFTTAPALSVEDFDKLMA